MTTLPAVKQIICEEVFDDRSQPSEDEIQDFAKIIGINPENEPHLLHLARDGLMKPLPKHWKPVYNDTLGRHYYFNFKTKETSWEHPLDNEYRQLVKKSRSESLSSAGEDESKTSIKEDLKSFEETVGSSLAISLTAETGEAKLAAEEPKMDLNKKFNPIGRNRSSMLGPLRNPVLGSTGLSNEQPLLSRRQTLLADLTPKKNSKTSSSSPNLVPLFKTKIHTNPSSSAKPFMEADPEVVFSHDEESDFMKRHKDKEKSSESMLRNSVDSNFSFDSTSSPSVIGRFKVAKIDIDKPLQQFDESKKSSLSQQEKYSKFGRSELTLSGGGSIFLKSNHRSTSAEEHTSSKNESHPDTFVSSKIPSFENENIIASDFSNEESDSDDKGDPKLGIRNVPLLTTRSILRTPQGDRPLWDVDPQQMSISEKARWRAQELEEEKKSVRFNLDKELTISFKLSSDDDPDSEEVVEIPEETAWNSEDEKDIKSFELHIQNINKKEDEADKMLKSIEKWTEPSTSKIEISEVSNEIPNSLKDAGKICDDSDSSKQDIERERALQDWNVTKNDSHRLQLTRQSSQQQLQIQLPVESPERLADRNQAYRDWNVIGGNDQVVLTSNTIGRVQNMTPKASKIFSDKHDEEISTMISNFPETSPEPSSDVMKISELSHEHSKKIDDERNFVKIEEEAQRKFQNLQIEHQRKLDRLDEEHKNIIKEREAEHKLKLQHEDQEQLKRLEQMAQEQQEKQKNKERELRENAARFEREAESRFQQIKEQLLHKQECSIRELQEQHQQALAAQEVENQATMLRIREQHTFEIKVLRDQLQREEDQLRREFAERLDNLHEDPKGKCGKELQEMARSLEKMRCEKRLVEDKYRTLKEKYIKLKGEVKMASERKEKDQRDKQKRENRNKGDKAEHNLIKSQYENHRANDQDISSSQSQTDRSSDRDSRQRSNINTLSSNAAGFEARPFQLLGQQVTFQSDVDPPSPAPENEKNLLDNKKDISNNGNIQVSTESGLKSRGGTTHQNISNGNVYGRVPHQGMWWNTAHSSSNNDKDGNNEKRRKHYQSQRLESVAPLDALRGQLRTLDELEEQFPAFSLNDTYLRYPFPESSYADLGNTSSAEVKFFQHRIHLERDLVRDAEDSYRAQQNEYQKRLHKFRQYQASDVTPSSTLHKMTQEEQELSKMEISLQHTRGLLSKRMANLRQLESSLRNVIGASSSHRPAASSQWAKRVFDPKRKKARRWDWKVGVGLLGAEDGSDDFSSDSGGSSGFSSTEHASDSTFASILNKDKVHDLQIPFVEETTDINTSLHNLNAEISEIWNVLCRQRTAAGLGPPPLLSVQHKAWPLPNSKNWSTSKDDVVSSGHVVPPLITDVNASHAQALGPNSSLAERSNSLRQWLQKAKLTASLSHSEQPSHLKQQLSL